MESGALNTDNLHALPERRNPGFRFTTSGLRSLPVKQVIADAVHVGISARRIQKVMRAAGVESLREGFGREAKYIWRLKAVTADA